MFGKQNALWRENMRADFLYYAFQRPGRLRPDDMVKHVETFAHHDLNIRCRAMPTEQVKASGRFSTPAGTGPERWSTT